MKRRHSIRKAAILIASLDTDGAARLLAQMSTRQAERVRQAISRLGQIDPAEQAEVIEEFFRIGPLVPDKQPAGIELDGHLARQLSPAADAASCDDADAPSFRILQEISDERLAPFLADEHPQTVAVVLSHLSAQRAADVLAGLPAKVQVEVARRLVDLHQTDPAILREVERGLQSWLADERDDKQRRTAGLTALKNILAAAGQQAKQEILANLANHDHQLAAKLALKPPVAAKPMPMTFSDLAQLDDAALTTVLHSADTEIMVLALAGASTALVERVLNQLPLEEAKTLKYALDHLGPTRLSDVEGAQRELARLAGELEARGELPRSLARRLSVAV